MNTEKDYLVYDVAIFLKANSDDDYQELVINLNTSFFNFLYNNGLLINVNPFDEQGNLKLDTKVNVSNLTDEGMQLFKNGTIDGWFDYIDRSTVPNKYNNIKRLEKGLAKLRETEN